FWVVSTDVRFGSKADMCSAQADVCFVPKADILANGQKQTFLVLGMSHSKKPPITPQPGAVNSTCA
ncbi:MAG: hypothetical protein WBY77_05855, partial [Pseudolabrys sp.]